MERLLRLKKMDVKVEVNGNKTIKGDQGEINNQLNAWADDRGFKWNGNKDTLKALGNTLKDNYQKNNQDQAQRQANYPSEPKRFS